MAEERYLRFVPDDAEGLPEVTEVVVFPDRLEVQSAGRQVVFRFADIARWPAHPAWWWRFRRLLGWRPRWLPVADKLWFGGRDGYFEFYTKPQLRVTMPAEGPPDYHASYYRQAQEIIGAGGFSLFDLG